MQVLEENVIFSNHMLSTRVEQALMTSVYREYILGNPRPYLTTGNGHLSDSDAIKLLPPLISLATTVDHQRLSPQQVLSMSEYFNKRLQLHPTCIVVEPYCVLEGLSTRARVRTIAMELIHSISTQMLPDDTTGIKNVAFVDLGRPTYQKVYSPSLLFLHMPERYRYEEAHHLSIGVRHSLRKAYETLNNLPAFLRTKHAVEKEVSTILHELDAATQQTRTSHIITVVLTALKLYRSTYWIYLDPFEFLRKDVRTIAMMARSMDQGEVFTSPGMKFQMLDGVSLTWKEFTGRYIELRQSHALPKAPKPLSSSQPRDRLHRYRAHIPDADLRVIDEHSPTSNQLRSHAKQYLGLKPAERAPFLSSLSTPTPAQPQQGALPIHDAPPQETSPTEFASRLTREERKRAYEEEKALRAAIADAGMDDTQQIAVTKTPDALPRQFEHSQLTVRDLTRGSTDNLHVQAILAYALADGVARTREEINTLVTQGLKKHFSIRGFGDALRWLEEHSVIVRESGAYRLARATETYEKSARELIQRVKELTPPAK